MRNIRFTILCDEDERKQISDLSRQLHRSQGDAIRFVIRMAIQQLTTNHQNTSPDNVRTEGEKNV